MADDAFLIDEEKTTIGYELSGDDGFAEFVNFEIACEDVVVFGDGFVDVGYERVGDALDAAFVLGSLEPSPVGEFRIRGATYDSYVTGFELAEFLLEAVEFGRAYEGEVLRVEEEYDVFFADVLFEGESFDDGFTFYGFGGECRGWFTYEYWHDDMVLVV